MSSDDKSTGKQAGWNRTDREVRFENNTSKLVDDTVELPNRDTTDYAYVKRADAVIIVPVTAEGEIVLVKQYRYPVDEWCLEVPAGGTHDTGSKSLEEVARKELLEEIGGTCEKLTYVTCFYSAPAFSDEKCHVFLAEGVKLACKPQREVTEAMKPQRVSIAEAFELARRGEMKSGPCALALLLCDSGLRDRS